MRPLRFGLAWLTLGWLLIAFALYSSVAPGSPPGLNLPDKLMHALTFCVLMFWFGGVYRARRFPVIGLLLLLFGLLIEAIQPQLSYRDAQSADFLADALGVGCGWLLALTVLGTWCVRAEGWISQLKQRA